MTQHYIGVKQVMAWPESKEGQDGYAVKYADGYMSWSPADEFERAYLPMGEGNDGTRVTPEMVREFVTDFEVKKLGEKTTVAAATLANGFELVESSSCVDPQNYDETMGAKICRERMSGEVWRLLGFLLQAAREGFNRSGVEQSGSSPGS